MRNPDKNIKKEKKVIISALIVVMVLLMILLAFRLDVFSGFAVSSDDEPEDELIYRSYKQICSKDNDYFEELAGLVGGDKDKRIREIKAKSGYCKTSDIKNITKTEVEDMECGCVERNWRKCPLGWELKKNYCYKGKAYTNSLIVCSFYRCEGNYFVEALKNEILP